MPALRGTAGQSSQLARWLAPQREHADTPRVCWSVGLLPRTAAALHQERLGPVGQRPPAPEVAASPQPDQVARQGLPGAADEPRVVRARRDHAMIVLGIENGVRISELARTRPSPDQFVIIVMPVLPDLSHRARGPATQENKVQVNAIRF